MNETWQYMKMFARFPAAVRRFAREPLTVARARELVKAAMEQRGENLLRLVERSVYGHTSSPYLALLKHAGCEFGDFRRLIQTEGVEGGLAQLRDAGVYVRFEEFKGREPIVRGNLILNVAASDFDNPHARRDFTVRTGGSTGLATLVSQDLDHIATQAPIRLLVFEAHELIGAPTSYWMHIMPGTGFRFLLQSACIGQWPEHWFSSLGWREHKEWPRFTAATFYLVTSARAQGLRIPYPEFLRVEDALVVARWLSQTVAKHSRALLISNVSHAMRVALAAKAEGMSLSGATFRIGGEPVTPAKSTFMNEMGIRVIAGYGMVETSNIAIGCPNGLDPGDMHVAMDTIALIAHPQVVGDTGITVPAFQITTLSDTSGKLLLNVQVDDCGIVEKRSCGCVLDQFGLDIHVRDVRSYTKLVGEGVTLLGNEMVHILEHVLPSKFGGSSLDYQLLEEEDESHLTRLYLTISPRVVIADDRNVVETLLDTLTNSSAAGGVASAAWRQGNSIRLRRAEPVWTARGKMMPLHIAKYSDQRPAASAANAADA